MQERVHEEISCCADVLGKINVNVTFRCKSKEKTTNNTHIQTHTHNEGKRLENFFVLFSEICDIYNYNSSSCRRRRV